MNHTHLFSIETDDSYGGMDFAIPGTFYEWLSRNESRREELAQHLEWLAMALRTRRSPFSSMEVGTLKTGGK